MELREMYLVRMCACMMWFAVWQLNGAQSQLTVEVREYTSSAKTSYKTLRTYSDPSGAPPLQDWFTARYVNIPNVFSNNTGFFQPNGGITGSLYYPNLRNSCSEVDTPPASNNSGTVWLAIVSGYPNCTSEKIRLLNTTGYRVMFTYSDGDTNRVPPPDTRFPVAIVTEEFANYLIQNATVTSADSLIIVHVFSDVLRQVVIAFCIVIALVLAGVLLIWGVGSVFLDMCRACGSNKSEEHNVSRHQNRNATRTRQQQRSRYTSREQDEQQSTRAGRSETIQLREVQRNVQQEEGQSVTVEVNTRANQQQESQVCNSEEQRTTGQSQPREVIQRQGQQSPGNVIEREETAQQQEHERQQPAQQQQRTRLMRLQNTVNMSARARQTLPETRQHQEATQQRRLEVQGRQRSNNQQRSILRLLEEGRLGEATQQSTSSNHQVQSTAEPFYGNVRTTSFRGHRQFNIRTESCKSCPICLVDFNDGETVRVLSCDQDHIFHAACLQPWITTHRSCPVCRENVTDAEGTAQQQAQEHGRQQPAQQQQRRRHMRLQNTVAANVSERARPTLSETRQHQEATQQQRQGVEGRQQSDNQQRSIPRLLEEGRPGEATQQSSSNQQVQITAEPFYGNIRTTSFRGHRQFNIQTESCKSCPICLVDFNDGETVRVLSCDQDHIFHATCLQPWITMHRSCPVCRENVTDGEETAQQERGRQQSAQRQQRRKRMRLQNTVASNVSERARQTLPATTRHQEAIQQRRQGEEGRQQSDNQQRSIPRLLEEGRPGRATQQSASSNQQLQNTAEPLYRNVRTTFRGHQFNIQTESCKACHICRVDFNDSETVQVLPCNPDHIFHAACVQPHITIHRKCPVCRENVTDRTMQRSASINQQLAEPLQYGSFWCRQFSNIRTESCKSCTICLVDFNNGETFRILPCDSDHIFHAACVQPWITMHGQCPVCRENIVHTS